MPDRERPGAPAQSAPPVGGREDGTLRVRPIATLRRPDSRSRRQPVKKATPTVRPGAYLGRVYDRAMDRSSPVDRSSIAASSPSSSWRAATPPRPRQPVPRAPADTVGAPAPSPSPSGSPDLAAVYAEINEQVRAIRGLEEKKPVEPTDRLARGDDRGARGRRSTRTTRPTRSPPTSAVPRPRAAAEGRQARRRLHRPPVEPGRRPVRPGRRAAVRRVEGGRRRGGREGLLLARVRPRPPGPELRPRGDHRRTRRPDGRSARPPVARGGRRVRAR